MLEGATHVALTGVAAGTRSTDGTFWRNVVIQAFSAEGVTVSGASVLGIQQGVSVLSNGFGTRKRSGLLISGTAHVNINVPAAASTTAFNKNAQHGILVSGSGWVFLKGTQNASAGTVYRKALKVFDVSKSEPAPTGSVNSRLLRAFMDEVGYGARIPSTLTAARPSCTN